MTLNAEVFAGLQLCRLDLLVTWQCHGLNLGLSTAVLDARLHACDVGLRRVGLVVLLH